MPNRNPYTNPNSITNSGSYYFTNRKSKIFKLNINLIENGDMIQSFILNEYNENFLKNNNLNYISNKKSENDFLQILQNQRNNSKTNKLKDIL